MKAIDISNVNRYLGDFGSRTMTTAGIVGVAAIAISIALGFGAGASAFFKSYLLAFCFVLSISLGALFFVFIQHATRAGWSVTVRRVAEALAGNLTWIWILFLPIAILVLSGNGYALYKWMNPAYVDPSSEKFDAIIAGKAAYLNITRFMIFAVLYFAIWALAARFFLNNSVRQDASGDPALTSRMQARSYIVAILFALTVTFAAIDWIMSLTPHWFSTIFGVYFFAGCACAGFSTMIIAIYALQRSGRLTGVVSAEHFQDLGKLLFAFGVVFWAYIAFSQYMLIWYANIPETTGWFMARQLGDWTWYSVFLLFGHFIGPFVLLISRHPKRRPDLLVIGAVWMLFMHLVDLYYLIKPYKPEAEMAAANSFAELQAQFAEQTIGLTLLDLTLVVGLTALYVAGTCFLMRDTSLLCEKDPRLSEAMAFENQ